MFTLVLGLAKRHAADLALALALYSGFLARLASMLALYFSGLALRHASAIAFSLSGLASL